MDFFENDLHEFREELNTSFKKLLNKNKKAFSYNGKFIFADSVKKTIVHKTNHPNCFLVVFENGLIFLILPIFNVSKYNKFVSNSRYTGIKEGNLNFGLFCLSSSNLDTDTCEEKILQEIFNSCFYGKGIYKTVFREESLLRGSLESVYAYYSLFLSLYNNRAATLDAIFKEHLGGEDKFLEDLQKCHEYIFKEKELEKKDNVISSNVPDYFKI